MFTICQQWFPLKGYDFAKTAIEKFAQIILLKFLLHKVICRKSIVFKCRSIGRVLRLAPAWNICKYRGKGQEKRSLNEIKSNINHLINEKRVQLIDRFFFIEMDRYLLSNQQDPHMYITKKSLHKYIIQYNANLTHLQR